MTDLLMDVPTEAVTAPVPQNEPCPCGSGLTHRHCCALDLAQTERTPPEAFADLLMDIERAQAVANGEVAKELAIEILEAAPGQRDALAHLYNALKNTGAMASAGVIIERLTGLYPNDPMSRMTAASYFLSQGQLAKALQNGRMLVRVAPMAAVSHTTMGQVFQATHNPSAAEHHLRLALDLIRPDEVDVLKPQDIEANLAGALLSQGRIAEARAIFERVDTHESSLAVLLAWAGLEEADRQFERARELLDRAEALAPDGPRPRITLQRAALLRRANQPEAALAAIEGLQAARAQDDDPVGDLLEKGQLLDSLGRYDEAWAVFDAFKARLRKTGQAYNADHADALAEGLKGFFTPERQKILPRADLRADVAQPIFIIGFPRSGTTLVEQTLTSHPSVSAGDELPMVNAIAQRSQMLLGSPGPYPIALSELWLGDRQGSAAMLRDLYLTEAAQMGVIAPGKPWFTDKMPLNETHLGLIHLMFPKSPVLHLIRHPLDVMVSVFSNGLSHGFNCASSLETAAQHFALIHDLVQHYLAALPVRYRPVRYEDIIAEQERVVREMLDFVGEPFDPATLAFHENRRIARTASQAQVTEKLYARSVYRYRNYLKHLEPIIPVLEPIIHQLGYTIEG